MSKQASNATLESMRDNDNHSVGNPTSDMKHTNSNVRGKEHTRPQGDLRDVADNSAFRGDFNRGH